MNSVGDRDFILEALQVTNIYASLQALENSDDWQWGSMFMTHISRWAEDRKYHSVFNDPMLITNQSSYTAA